MGDALGTWIGENGHTLIYGGATGGLMTRTSNAAKAAGATVIGVIPPRIKAAGRKADNCDELYMVQNMSERKQIMRDMADVIVCLPGSYGTLDEMMENYKGFYEPLKQQIEAMRSLHFIPEQEAYKPIFVDTLEELYNKINN